MLNDQDEPVRGPNQRQADNAIASAGALSRNPRFQQWMFDNEMAPDVGEDAAVAGIRDFCGILSRAEFSTNENARKKFLELRHNFDQDYKKGKVK